jgi:quinol monooxygenase YgiN
MVLLIIRMKVNTETRMELSQTFLSLSALIRKEKGCLRCDFLRAVENENEFHIFEEWETLGGLKSHLKSDRFKVLRGAMNLLKEPAEIVLYNSGKRRGKRKVKTVAAAEDNAGALKSIKTDKERS